VALDAMEGAYLAVGMHELVHYVKAANADGYALLEDFVLEALRDSGVDVEARIEQQQKANPALSEAAAREEVVANSVPVVLDDEATVRRLVEQDRSLAEKIADFFEEFLANVKQILSDISRYASWAQVDALKSDTKTVQAISDLFFAVLDETSERADNDANAKKNDAKASENTANVNENVDIQYSAVPGYLEAVNSEIVDAFEKYRDGTLSKYMKPIMLSPVSDRFVHDVFELVKIEIEGYKHGLQRDGIEHIERRHGEHGAADHSMKDVRDIGRMQFVIDNYDSIDLARDSDGNQVFSRKYKDKHGNYAPVLSLVKRVNGLYYVSEAIPDAKRKTIWVASVWKNKKGAVQVLNADALNSYTSETKPESTPKKSIREKTDFSKPLSIKDSAVSLRETRVVKEDSYENRMYSAIFNGKGIGHASVLVDDNGAYVERLDIDDAFRRQGFGTNFIMQLANKFGGITIAPDSEDSRRLYARLGDVAEAEYTEYLDEGFGVYYIDGSLDAKTDDSKKFSLKDSFVREYDVWDKSSFRAPFTISRTSHALQYVGVREQSILWDASKIKKIRADHPGMTDAIIKQVPDIIDNPVIIMESQTVKSRITLFGEVFDANNAPVLVALELEPRGQNESVLNIIKVASAYGKDADPQRLLDTSRILYVNPEQAKTRAWLKLSRLQLPLSAKFGLNNRISYRYSVVNNNVSDEGIENTNITKKFSLKDAAPETRVDVKALEKENKRLSEALAIAKAQFKLTEGHKLSDKAVDMLARRVLKEYSSKYNFDSLKYCGKFLKKFIGLWYDEFGNSSAIRRRWI
jgi:hypothetical protein